MKDGAKDMTERNELAMIALGKIARIALANDGAVFDLILAEIATASGQPFVTSDAVREINQATGCGFNVAHEAFQRSGSVASAIKLVESERLRD